MAKRVKRKKAAKKIPYREGKAYAAMAYRRNLYGHLRAVRYATLQEVLRWIEGPEDTPIKFQIEKAMREML